MKSWIRRIDVNSLVLSLTCLFVLGLFSQRAEAQVTLTTDRAVNVRAAPSRTSKIISVLPAEQKVILESTRGYGNYFKVRLDATTTGWMYGDYLLVPDLESIAAVPGAVTLGAGAMPACGSAPHYRWREKTSTSGLTQQPGTSNVNAVLQWAALPFHGHSISSWCTDRIGRELKPYSVLGWVRRTKNETDGDVHIEITQSAGDAVENCVVVEIPPADLSSKFAKARTDLASLLAVSGITDKDFDTPVRLRFTGLAFWDGWHFNGTLPVGHGRCNSTIGATWELHGVFKVTAP